MDKKEKARLRTREWYYKNHEYAKQYRRNRYLDPEFSKEASERTKRWRIENREKFLETRERTKDKKAIRDKRYREKNQGKCNAIKKRYKLAKKNRTPRWLSKEQIKEIDNFYILAYNLSQETDIQHHVDHIIPLQGNIVSGLHVPWNLQILTGKENRKKSNKVTNE